MDLVKEEESDIKWFLHRLKKRDFSGTTGIALKNSVYQFSTTFMGKLGSLLLTIIFARLLMPEVFGLYSLALSTILIFVAFSDLGIGDTLIRFVSRELGRKKPGKAKAYSNYLIRIKILIMLLVSIILILFAKFIAHTYYHKPIMYALIAGSLYIFFGGTVVILQAILQSHNLFKPILYREIIFQVIRIIIIPLVILLYLQNVNNSLLVLTIIVILSLSFAVSVILLYYSSKRTILMQNVAHKPLSQKDKKEVKKFVFLNSTIILSGIFFGYIDIVMLGYFVASEYIGYFQGAFSFINAAISLITFSAALLPVFSRLNKKKMDYFFKKTIRIVSVVSVASFLFILLLAKPLILIIFGNEYANSINILRLLSILLLAVPITTIYSTYFISSGKPAIISKSLIASTLLNIILNYIFISYFLNYGQLQAVYGSAIATIISRYAYLGFLVIWKKKNK